MGKKFHYFFFKFQDGLDAGKDVRVLVHTRFIGEKIRTKKIILEGSDPSNEETEEVEKQHDMRGSSRLPRGLGQKLESKLWNDF